MPNCLHTLYSFFVFLGGKLEFEFSVQKLGVTVKITAAIWLLSRFSKKRTLTTKNFCFFTSNFKEDWGYFSETRMCRWPHKNVSKKGIITWQRSKKVGRSIQKHTEATNCSSKNFQTLSFSKEITSLDCQRNFSTIRIHGSIRQCFLGQANMYRQVGLRKLLTPIWTIPFGQKSMQRLRFNLQCNRERRPQKILLWLWTLQCEPQTANSSIDWSYTCLLQQTLVWLYWDTMRVIQKVHMLKSNFLQQRRRKKFFNRLSVNFKLEHFVFLLDVMMNSVFD